MTCLSNYDYFCLHAIRCGKSQQVDAGLKDALRQHQQGNVGLLFLRIFLCEDLRSVVKCVERIGKLVNVCANLMRCSLLECILDRRIELGKRKHQVLLALRTAC